MTKTSVITNRLSITMAGLIIDYLSAPISQPYTFPIGVLTWCLLCLKRNFVEQGIRQGLCVICYLSIKTYLAGIH